MNMEHVTLTVPAKDWRLLEALLRAYQIQYWEHDDEETLVPHKVTKGTGYVYEEWLRDLSTHR
jgi:hypothetical protein